MKKLIFTFIILLSFAANAQISTAVSNSNKKWTFGGGFGLGFGGNNAFNLQLAPRVGYKLTDNIEAGGSVNFAIQNNSYFNSTILGAGPFVNYYFAKSFFAGVNFNQYFITTKEKTLNLKSSSNETALLLSGGYVQRFGGIGMQLGMSYNVLWKENKSIFSSAWTPTVGVVFGL